MNKASDFTVETFSKAVMSYIQTQEAKDQFADLAGLRLCLKLSKAEMNKLTSEDNPDCEAYREILDYAQDRRESWLARTMTTDNKRQQGCYNAIKQTQNGGWADKSTDNGDKVLNLKLHGLPNGMEAFK